ncbi:MAG: hypothetical protein PVI06_15990 [Desulfobacterales bacterium]|jgi:cation transport ATPase
MMTLIGAAIIVAYVYSSAVAFNLSGKVFFWEVATLIDIMLLAIGLKGAQSWVPAARWKNWSS